MELDGPDGVRYCSRCHTSVPVSEWRLEHKLEWSIVHVGEMRGVVFDLEDDDHSCRSRERVPKVQKEVG